MKVVIIGFSAAGKTSVANVLTSSMGEEVFSTDRMLEDLAGMPLLEIVQTLGWPGFRELEHRVLQELAAKEDGIVDAGGGVIVHHDAPELLTRNARVFHIHVPFDIIVERFNGMPRGPLLGRDRLDRAALEELERIYNERLPVYKDIADHTVENWQEPVEGAAGRIMELLDHSPPSSCEAGAG